ncbi:MAG: hypothetical protein EOO68_06595 [Moraxellaceae bacterium]|nr:MAG: hypothetical protein EOO68_06595 [Moraxellaceae bacterium]
MLTSVHCACSFAEEVPYYQQILNRLKSDTDVILPWAPNVLDTSTMSNREAPIPPQCYTDSSGVHNPCYVCHQDNIPGRENTMGDRDLQEAYSFSDAGLTNHWVNLFEDRSARVNQISDAQIQAYVNTDNYSELAQRLRGAGFTGWIPDLANLQLGAAAFDHEGFAKDGSWWVAFNYKPLPSTFWPTQGSTDDVMIRLPPEFYKTPSGIPSREVYKANLAILEANIKGVAVMSSLLISEITVGEDLNGDNKLALVNSVSALRERYVGAANQIELIPFVFPMGTEFLHTVRYVGVDADGAIFNPKRMKEVRYMKRRIQSRHFQLQHFYQEENLEKEQGSLPTYKNFGQAGLSSNFGWNITGFIENKEGRLRWNTYEENVFCMGCHTSIGSTIDKTFSFARKLDGAAGWGYINLRALKDAPNVGEPLNEIATYLNRVGGGTEFRSNPELESRFYHANGSVNTIALAATQNVYDLTTPSAARALTLNKAYKAIVEQQDFIFGRDATVTAPQRVLASVNNETSPTLSKERQFDWDIRLDWNSVSNDSCNYRGDVDFAQLNGAVYTVNINGTAVKQFNALCTEGAVTLTGILQVNFDNNFTPDVGNRFDIIRAGNLIGDFSELKFPQVNNAVFKPVKTATLYSLLLVKDSDNDAIADVDDNCTQTANGSQQDTDADGYGNACDADLNNDGITNQLDAVIFRGALGSTNPHADFNHDGIVNQIDANLLRIQLGKPPGPARKE